MNKWLGTIRVLPAGDETPAAAASEITQTAVTTNDELATHYALACKGDKTRALLMALAAGYDFTRVVGAFGDEGVKIAFDCLLKGWINHGQITSEGRVIVQNGADA